MHQLPREERERESEGRYFQIGRGNYFKGCCCAAEKQFFCNEINISGFDGSIENSGLVDAYHRDYSASYAGPLMQIKILIRG